jgi:hypothetical protein
MELKGWNKGTIDTYYSDAFYIKLKYIKEKAPSNEGAFSICEKVENFMQYLYRGLHTSIEVSKELCYNIF